MLNKEAMLVYVAASRADAVHGGLGRSIERSNASWPVQCRLNCSVMNLALHQVEHPKIGDKVLLFEINNLSPLHISSSLR
jgi:hypothetical protein